MLHPHLCCVQVRDSKVSFTKDAEKGMLVHLVHSKKEAKGDAAGTGASIDRLQSMQSYSMMDWQDWRTYLQQSDCLMQHRTGQMYTGDKASRRSRVNISSSTGLVKCTQVTKIL